MLRSFALTYPGRRTRASASACPRPAGQGCALRLRSLGAVPATSRHARLCDPRLDRPASAR
eukprot:12162294-Alexandrium_andersonii.AAC.1